MRRTRICRCSVGRGPQVQRVGGNEREAFRHTVKMRIVKLEKRRQKKYEDD